MPATKALLTQNCSLKSLSIIWIIYALIISNLYNLWNILRLYTKFCQLLDSFLQSLKWYIIINFIIISNH